MVLCITTNSGPIPNQADFDQLVLDAGTSSLTNTRMNSTQTDFRGAHSRLADRVSCTEQILDTWIDIAICDVC